MNEPPFLRVLDDIDQQNERALLTPEVEIMCAAGIKPEPIDWMWPEWLAAGKLHILAGAPGTGKTTLALALAAALTTRGKWPCGADAPLGDVLIWSGEDDPKDTLVPRLMACGANLERVHIICGVSEADGSRSFDPAQDAILLREAAEKIGRPIRLLVVDPVVSAVAGDSHKNAEVRRALQPLVDLGQAMRAAVLGISHFTKGTAGKDPVDRVTGSLAFGALARVVLATAKLPDEDGREDVRILARAKSNIGPDSGGFEYHLEQVDIPNLPGVRNTRVTWGSAIDGTARELLAQAETDADPEARSAIDEAKEFLLEILANGPLSKKEVEQDADGMGISVATLRRAKKILSIESRKDGYGKKGTWKWSLPSKVLKKDQRGSTPSVSALGEIEHLSENEEYFSSYLSDQRHKATVVKYRLIEQKDSWHTFRDPGGASFEELKELLKKRYPDSLLEVKQ